MPEEYINLLFSVMQRQVDDIKCVLQDELTSQIERDGKRAIRWLFYDSGEYIMSAKSICYIMGFDVQMLQDKIKSWDCHYDKLRNRIIYEEHGFRICKNEHYKDDVPTPKLSIWANSPNDAED